MVSLQWSKTIIKTLLRPIINSAMNLSEFKAITCQSFKADGNAYVQGEISFGFTFSVLGLKMVGDF